MIRNHRNSQFAVEHKSAFRSACISATCAAAFVVAGAAFGTWSSFGPGSAFGPVLAHAENLPPGALRSLCEKVQPAYVFISGGSGVVIRPDGLMLTNNHVIERGDKFDVRLGNGRHYRATLLGRDVFGDLAALQLQLKDGETVPYLELGDSDALQVGESALAVGNPFGLGLIDQNPTFTFGVVSGVRQLQGRYTECIVTDAEVNPGNSGGPLINMAGKVVGINGQISTRWGLRSNTGLGYAISARQIRLWLPRLTTAGGKEVRHGRPVGLEFEAAPLDAPKSVVIKAVAENTPAAAAEFKSGDTIVKWDGLPVPNAFRLASIIGMYPEGHEVAVVVKRGDMEVALNYKLNVPGRRPAPKDAEKKDDGKKEEAKKEEPKKEEGKKDAGKPEEGKKDGGDAKKEPEKKEGEKKEPEKKDGK